MNKKIYIALFISEFFILSMPAHAYLDPGTGSMILQALVGAVAAGLMFGRSYIYKIKMFFQGFRPDSGTKSCEDEKPK